MILLLLSIMGLLLDCCQTVRFYVVLVSDGGG